MHTSGETPIHLCISIVHILEYNAHTSYCIHSSVTTKVDFCPLAGAKPLAYQNSKPLAGGKPLVSRPNLWLAGRTFGWPAGPLVGNRMS